MFEVVEMGTASMKDMLAVDVKILNVHIFKEFLCIYGNNRVLGREAEDRGDVCILIYLQLVDIAV